MLYFSAQYSGLNGVLARRRLRSDGAKIVLNYHHVLPAERINKDLVYGYSHSTDAFRAQIKSVLDLAPFDLDFKNGQSITLTFDDGAINNFQFALPILDELGIQAYFFINDRHTESDSPNYLWIDKWYAWFSYAPAGSYPFANLSLEIGPSFQSRIAAQYSAWRYLVRHYAEKDELLKVLYARFDPSDSMAQRPERFDPLTVDQLNEMKKRGHLIGFHTPNHHWLGSLNMVQLKQEMDLNAQPVFHDLINSNVLSIPFGTAESISPSVVQLIGDQGFDHVLMNEYPSSVNGYISRLNLPNTSDPTVYMSAIAGWPRHFQRHAS